MTNRSVKLRALTCAPLIAAYSAAARADDAPVALEWNVPEGERCPSADEVTLQVTKLVGAGRSGERGVIRARADVRKLGDGHFRVELTTVANGSEGHRVIEERSCRAMAEATAVILAWMVDPNAVDVPEVAAPPKPSDAAAAPKSPPREGQGARFVLGAHGLFDLGTLPGLAPGLGVEAGVRWPVARVILRGGLWPRQTTYVAQSSRATPAGAELGLFTLGLDGCVAPLRWDVAACGGPELERLEGTGFGVATPRSNGVFWVSFGFGVDGRVALAGPLGIAARLRLVVPTRREIFGLDGLGDVHRPDVIAGRAAIGLDALF